jgi:hypothetical protein
MGFLAATALLVSCGGDDEPTVAVDATTTTQAGGAPVPGSDTTAPTEPASAPAVTTPSGDDATVVEPEPASPAQESAADGSAGSFAPEILGGGGELLIEVINESGVGAGRGTIDHVTSTLATVSGKPTSAVTSPRAAPRDDSWTADELRAVADAAGTPQSDGRVVVHLIFVHGRWADSDTVLGVAVRGDTAAVFVDAVAEASNPLVGAGAIETAATMHEVGHLLGLVDLQLDTGREDPEHPGHSRNRDSVMYWAVESTLITDVLAGGPPRDFDADDRRDLETIRQGA